MRTDDLRLPGRRERPPNWTPTPTTPARSWAELTETLQGGLAVIDGEWRLRFVSDRFLPVLGPPGELIGNDLSDLLPSLATNDPRDFRQQIESGESVAFEEQFGDGNERRWFLVAVVPSTGLGSGLVAVVFAKEITDDRRALSRLRNATVGLTEVEGELHRRVGRDVHDGPIQLLAALMFRLGLSDTPESRELQQAVSPVAASLRNVIADFSPELRHNGGPSLQQWIAPFLEDSEIEVAVDDQRALDPGETETQAAFVLLYMAVRAAKDYGGPRSMRMVLTDEGGGQHFLLTFQSSAERTNTVGRARAQHRLLEHHARALDGTLSSWLDERDVRRVSMWIPNKASPATGPRARPVETIRTAPVGSSNDVSLLPSLDEATWRQIADAAPERLVEFDNEMSVSFANPVQHDLVGARPDELIGLSAEEMFAAESLIELGSAFDQLDRGELVETEWHRENVLGDSRLIHLRMSPRLDENGVWQGLLVSTDDRTDIELLEGLYEQALGDLAQARRLAIERSIQRLDVPLAQCEQLVRRLQHSTNTTLHAESIRTISTELETSLRRIKDSTSVLTPARLSIGDLALVLRSSLGGLLVGRRLVVVDETESPPSEAIADVVFRIAREAVNNAVMHGRAGLIMITLSNRAGGVACEIHDNGIGIEPGQLRLRPGHLGLRGMQERARERGGTLRIERDQRGGTLVSVWLPERNDRPSLLDTSAAGA